MEGRQVNEASLIKTIDSHVSCLLSTYALMGFTKGQIASLFIQRFNSVIIEETFLGAELKNLDREMIEEKKRDELVEDRTQVDILTLTGSLKTNSEKLRSLKSMFHSKFKDIRELTEVDKPYSTSDLNEKKAIKTFSFSGSLIDRFPFSKDRVDNIDNVAAKVVSSIERLGESEPTESEKLCLKELRKESGLDFQSNSNLFYKRNYCGTPDAIYMKDGKIENVAEFKVFSQKSLGVNQLKFYLNLLGLQSGYLCLDNKGNVSTIQVTLDQDYLSNLGKRTLVFNNFKSDLNI